MADVLVAGGTGFIGSHIVRKLLDQGHRMTILTRNPDRSVRSLPSGATMRKGDVRDGASLDRAMQGMDVVVHAVQFPNHPIEKPGKGFTYMAVDGEGTVRQVEAARKAGVKRFIYISGAGTREGQTAPWFKAKLMAERAVRESGIPYTIFQPSWVYGPEDRTLNRLVLFARTLPFVPIIGDGKTRIQPVHVDDLAEAVVRSLTSAEAVGKTYEIGGPETLTMDEIMQIVLSAMGKRKPLIHHPKWFMKLVSAPLSLLPTPPLSPATVDFVTMEEPVDNGPLSRDLGCPLRTLVEGIDYLRR